MSPLLRYSRTNLLPMFMLRFLPFLLLLSACTGASDHSVSSAGEQVLESAKAKVAANATYRYHYSYRWDNGYSDSLNIHYTRLAGTEPGFAFLAEGTDKDIFFDGDDLLQLNHHQRTAIRTTAATIAARDDYFLGKLYFQATPFELPDLDEVDQAQQVTLNEQQLWAYEVTTQQVNTASNPVDTTVETQTYFISPEENVLVHFRRVVQQRGTIIRTVDVSFSDHAYEVKPHSFTAADRPKTSRYLELSPQEVARKKQSRLITVGERLTRADYSDLQGKEQLLYGVPGKKSVVMFGFIGCGLCESALRKMAAKDYYTQPNLTLYYSSPVDQAAKLEQYLQRKGLPYAGFSKESHMNDNFGVAAFPTFVFIDEQGVVEAVFGGYDDEVARRIMGGA